MTNTIHSVNHKPATLTNASREAVGESLSPHLNARLGHTTGTMDLAAAARP